MIAYWARTTSNVGNTSIMTGPMLVNSISRYDHMPIQYCSGQLSAKPFWQRAYRVIQKLQQQVRVQRLPQQVHNKGQHLQDGPPV